MFLRYGITKQVLFALKDNCFIFDYFKWGSTLITMKIYHQYDEFDRERKKEGNQFQFQGDKNLLMLSGFNRFFNFTLDRFQLDGKEFF